MRNPTPCRLLGLAVFCIVPAAAQAQQPAPLRGDANGDGRVTAADAQVVRDYVARRPALPDPVISANGDVNGDGRVTAVDAAMIQAYAAGRDVSRFGLGRPGNAVAVLYECTVDVDAGTHACQAPRPGGGARLDLVAGKAYVGFATTGAASFRGDASNEDTTVMNVALVNLMAQPIGTVDGTTPSPSGNRTFLHGGPTVTAVKVGTLTNETARMGNPDGTGNFTNPEGTYSKTGTPYYQYDGVLAKNDTSPARRWEFVYSANTRTFSYSVYVSAPVQYEYGWITLSPASPVVAAGAMATLRPAVYSAFGAPLTEAVTWSSSNTAVATVHPSTGVVTGVGEGTTTITAASAVHPQRKGTTVVTGGGGVPAQAPDSVPESVYAPENLGTNLVGMSGTYLRDIVSILFTPGASVQDRQAAVDLVRGTVIGGQRVLGDDGFYLVRIPGDGTANPILNAINALDALPQVVGASPEFIQSAEDAVTYERPDDGPGWTQKEWNLDVSRAGTPRWGLEAIGAPMAWGCATGDANTEVAVVDHGFFLNFAEDIELNTHERHYFAHSPIYRDTTAVRHGNQVASIIAARGGNRQAMTGVLWNAKLNLFEAGTTKDGKPTFLSPGKPSIRNTKVRISEAIWSGARVINVSISLDPDTGMSRRIREGRATKADSTYASEFGNSLRWPILLNRLGGRRPLLVFAAGNAARTGQDGKGNPNPGVLDAFWSGYPNLAADYPDQVIAVGSAMQAGTPTGGFLGGPFLRSPFSQGGPLVSIAAPGTQVGSMNILGQVVSGSGTSFAAPLVTGAAGLLFSFDPSLTTAEVVKLLLEGARRGNRYIEDYTTGSIPVLNVYESLKLAAQRPGAPLCGSRVWGEAKGIYVDRAGVPEKLFDLPQGYEASNINVMHGGRFIRVVFEGLSDNHLFARQPDGNWTLQSLTSTAPSTPGTTYSRLLRSHDSDSIMRMTSSSSVSGATDVQINDSSRVNPWKLVTTLVPPALARGTSVTGCIIRNADTTTMCYKSVALTGPRDVGRWTGAYSPGGAEGVFAFSVDSLGHVFTDQWIPCARNDSTATGSPVPWGAKTECRLWQQVSWTVRSELTVVRIDSATAQPLNWGRVSVGSIDMITIAEDGSEISYLARSHRRTLVYAQDPDSQTDSYPVSDDLRYDCVLESRNRRSGSITFSRAIPNCSGGQRFRFTNSADKRPGD